MLWPIAAAQALTVYTDNMMPTYTYPGPCLKGSIGAANPCQTDNVTVTIFAETSGVYMVTTANRHVITQVDNGQYEAKTKLTFTAQSPPVFSGSAETDIIYWQGPVPGGNQGYTWCDDPINFAQCDQQYIQIEATAFQLGLVCHETGHAVGLTHGTQANPVKVDSDPDLDCMRKPTPSGQQLGYNSINNIDFTY